ncbi:MAG: cbb3-type cytochrome oxidase subunit 3 [Hyphomicrobiales bacterium]|jgi:cbb3-type cytochrome oxidase subunit 3
MSAEALIGYSEAAFLTVGLVAILFLIIRVYHPGSREAMDDHANIIFRGEDAPEPRSEVGSQTPQDAGRTAARQDHNG